MEKISDIFDEKFKKKLLEENPREFPSGMRSYLMELSTESLDKKLKEIFGKTPWRYLCRIAEKIPALINKKSCRSSQKNQ